MHFTQHQPKTRRFFARASLLPCLLALLLSACGPQPEPDETPIDTQSNGFYVLNEGLFQLNNSTISYYDGSNFTEDMFLVVNHRGLGDTGNDLKRYGGKLYCAVNNSNRIDIMEFGTLRSIQAIDLPNKQPRQIAFYAGKAFVTCFDGDVVRIDTATLCIDATFHSGDNPEGICVANGKLYVANSGGLNYPNYGNTIAVFDAATLNLIRTLTVEQNPYKLYSDDAGRVYACCRGNYSDKPGRLYQISAHNDQITRTWPDVQNFLVSNHRLYVYSVSYKSGGSAIRVMDLENSADSLGKPFITDGTTIEMPYCLAANPYNGEIYITDAHNYCVSGDLYCFGTDGRKRFSLRTGINPGCIVFK